MGVIQFGTMAIPDDASHVVISGVCVSAEAFAFGVWFDDPSGPPDADLDVSTAFSTFRTALQSRMSSQQEITAYDVYRYSGGVVAQHDHKDVSHVGTDTSGQLPLQVSLVLTLRTATLSRRGRGRLYLPTCGASMMGGGGHLFGSTPVNPLVDDFATWLSAVNLGTLTAVVVSRVGGVMEPITSVDADYVPDTQRRRSNKLVSSRYVAAV